MLEFLDHVPSRMNLESVIRLAKNVSWSTLDVEG